MYRQRLVRAFVAAAVYFATMTAIIVLGLAPLIHDHDTRILVCLILGCVTGTTTVLVWFVVEDWT